MHRARELDEFSGIFVGEHGILVTHLQFADDTLIGEANYENIQTVKALLELF
jgi:hypothetical protein